MRCLVVALVFLLMVAPGVWAQEYVLPPIDVYGESDNDELRQCLVTHDSAVAQAEATLRSNRVGVTQTPTANQMHFYVNLPALPDSNGYCAYSVHLVFGAYAPTRVPVTGETVFLRIEFCEKGGLLVWPRATAQAQVNATIQDAVNRCLSEYQRLERF